MIFCERLFSSIKIHQPERAAGGGGWGNPSGFTGDAAAPCSVFVPPPCTTTFHVGPAARLSNKYQLLGRGESPPAPGAAAAADKPRHSALLSPASPRRVPGQPSPPGPAPRRGHRALFTPPQTRLAAFSRLLSPPAPGTSSNKPRVLGRHPLGGNVLPAERSWGRCEDAPAPLDG